MQASPSPSLVFVGIDVAKDHLDVHLRPSGEAFRLARDADALEELAARLVGLAPELIVLEATGAFEVAVAAALAGVRLRLAVVNPRAFARAVGRLAKTDRLDAEVIALFAERVRPQARAIPDAQMWALARCAVDARCAVAKMLAKVESLVLILTFRLGDCRPAHQSGMATDQLLARDAVIRQAAFDHAEGPVA